MIDHLLSIIHPNIKKEWELFYPDNERAYMDILTDNIQYIILVSGLILFLLTIFFVTRWYLGRSMRRDVFRCANDFILKCHEQDFYCPTRRGYMEYVHLYDTLNRRRKAWYLYGNNDIKFLKNFLEWFEMANDFIKRMANYMEKYHYFAHSEFLSCIEGVDFHKTMFPLMKEEFFQYIYNVDKKNPTVSLSSFEERLRDFSDIPKTHNDIFVEEELSRQKTYFDTVLKFPLSQQQRESIVKMEDNCLVVSSAGSGKTATSVAKIKYLVEKRGVDPSKILSFTYTRRAAEELSRRLGTANRNLKCHTFSSFAFHIVQEVTGKTPDLCEKNLMLQCFYKLIDDNAEFKESVNEFLTQKSSLTKYEHDYTSAREYYKDRALYGIQAPFKDMDGRIIFTRSEEEKKICTFLSMNNVSFRYEEPFRIETADKDTRQYRPDFTIYYERKGRYGYIILEHFGIDAEGNVPIWFGEGQRGGFAGANQEYNEGIAWKRAFCQQHGVVLLETTSAMFQDGTIYDHLTRQLQQQQVPMRPLTEDEQFDRLVRRNKQMEDALLQLISTFLTQMKSNRSTYEGIIEVISKENRRYPKFIERSKFMMDKILMPMYDAYQKTLKDRRQMDYADLILQATDLCEAGRWTEHYHTILVDEFQDISMDKFKFLQSLRHITPLTKLYCVGDDWQSIFRFSGSDLTLFNSFEDYFGYTEKCKMEKTYRFGEPIIGISTEFILKNPSQMHKELCSNDNQKRTVISLHEYEKENHGLLSLVQSLVQSIDSNESIMFLGRYNSDADFIPRNSVLEWRDGYKVSKVRIAEREIPFRSVHSAKGLEADHIILVNCSQDGGGFPSTVSDDPILGYLLSKPESYPYAEERRLFYVAITRAKKHSYILYNVDCPSPFVNEVARTINHEMNAQNMICPMCNNGHLHVLSEGENQYNRWRLYGCTNRAASCKYTWFVRFNDERNLVHEFHEMVRQAERRINRDAVQAPICPAAPPL